MSSYLSPSEQPVEPESELSFDPREYLRLIFTRWRLLALVCGLTLLSAVLLYFDDEEAAARAIDEKSSEYQAYTAEDLEAHHIDRALQTDLDARTLENNLLTIYRKAIAIEKEHGYNTLYLTLGRLEWYESDRSGELFESPLLLVPVELTRKQAGKRFYLRSRDEDAILNPALERRLAAGHACKRGQDIHGCCQLLTNCASRNLAGPPHDRGHSERAFRRGVSPTEKRRVGASCWAGLISHHRGTIVRCPDH